MINITIKITNKTFINLQVNDTDKIYDIKHQLRNHDEFISGNIGLYFNDAILDDNAIISDILKNNAELVCKLEPTTIFLSRGYFFDSDDCSEMDSINYIKTLIFCKDFNNELVKFVRDGDFKCVKSLLYDHMIPVNKEALITGCEKGHYDIVKLLIDHVKNVELLNDVLKIAVYNNQTEIIKILTQHN